MTTANTALRGKRVLVTRAPSQAQRFIDALESAGAEPLSLPLIDIAPPDDEPAALAAAQRAGEYDWIVFTSANGVNAFFERFHGRVAGTRIAAIGSATAAALARHGANAALVPRRQIAEALAESLIAQSHAGERILLFRAQDARDALPSMLRIAGRTVDDVAAYKTIAKTQPELARLLAHVDVVAFASGSAVRSFVANGGSTAMPQPAPAVAVIGAATNDVARECGVHVDVIAEESSAQGLVRALQAHFTPC